MTYLHEGPLDILVSDDCVALFIKSVEDMVLTKEGGKSNL